ncbi:bpX6 domain-containing protein [Nannocystis punicea]|uniref:BpX6 domain-containing protein n=1 Tax=Nannocystis punicea TaxID=2995304 RepID=A0ABY7GZX0_9BACT|nr:bpX6 domain-containing protein [Nannocystis poenicansa]WAS92420.1 bpX6 domain-containing protein [Nannocystis poenicansa]
MTAATVRPRQTLHRGSVEAIGVLVSDLAGDELAARRKILDLWRPGTTVFVVAEQTWLVRWPLPQRLRCDRAPGLPIVSRGSWLTTAPLADDELAALAAPAGALLYVRHGACEVVSLERTVDVAEWLAVADFEPVEVGSLGDPPRPAASSHDPAPPVRALFRHLVAAPPADARDVAAAMQTAARRRRGLFVPAAAQANAGDLSGAAPDEPRASGKKPVAAIAVVLAVGLLAASQFVGAGLYAALAAGGVAWAAARSSRSREAATEPTALARKSGSIPGTGEPAAPTNAAITRKAGWIAGIGTVGGVAMLLAAPLAAVSALGVLATIPVMLAVAGVLRRVLGMSGAPSSPGASPPPPQPLPRPLPAPPSPPPAPSRLRDLMLRMLARAGLLTGLNRRHARYLQRLVDMFERGDYDQALRHAIPLGDGDGEPGPPALRGPTVRKDLQIRPGPAAPSSSLLLAGDDFSFLRQTYRAAFDRLVKAGRIDEAAFLLAELLHADEEAVGFLERHDRRRLAAEIAEARNLAPGLVVRQWFLAGERQRGILVARRKGAFADAVARLERDPQHRDEASALRRAWAGTLAAAGDYEVAVEIATPDPSAISDVRRWMDLAIARGGPGGARMLGRALQRFPDDLALHLEELLRLADPDEPAHTDARKQLLDVLVAGPVTDAVRLAARPLLRGLLVDADRGDRPIDEAKLQTLALALGADALRVDLPAWPKRQVTTSLAMRSGLRHLEFGPGDVGAIAVHDLALLPDGKLLVALGELGVRLYARDGRLLWYADQPAESLVLSDHGDRAIAVVGRGRGVVRLARLDLVRHKATSWCEGRLARWAANFDGHTWLVAESSSLRPDRQQLVVVDVLVDTELRALDRRDLDDAAVLDVARSAAAAVVLLARPSGELERWRWDLPDWTLRRREELPHPDQLTDPNLLGPHLVGPIPCKRLCSAESPRGEHVACYKPDIPNLPALLHVSYQDQRAGTLRGLNGAPTSVVVDGNWLAVVSASETSLEVLVMTVDDREPRAVVLLAGARRATLRLTDQVLAIADDRGRALVIDLLDGEVSRSLRIV